jgi:hypothetical protein
MIPIVLFVISVDVQAQYYTNTNYIYDVTGKSSTVYAATNGGAIAYDYENSLYSVLTNTEGLQLNRQQCVGLDSSGYVWIGNELGLTLIDPDFQQVYRYPADYLPSTRIRTIICVLDSIYVGSTNGLLFIDTKGTPHDFTDDSRLRIFQMGGLSSSNIRTIALDSAGVWVGTDDGIAYFAKNFDPALTRTYTTSSGLLANSINKIEVVDSLVYVATDHGLNRFQGDYFDTILVNYGVNDICSTGDSLVLALDTLSQIGFYFADSLRIVKNGLPNKCNVLSVAAVNGTIFCGLGNRSLRDYFGEGIGRFDSNDIIWRITKRQCINSNHITEITASDDGVFVACGARANESRGLAWLTNENQWINFTQDSILPSDDIHRCTTSPDKKVWCAMNSFPNVSTSVMAISFDPQTKEWNFIHNGYNGMEGTVGVWDIEFDDRNNMYLALSGPTDKIWVIDSALNTVYFLHYKKGYHVEIALDSTGKIYRTLTGDEGGLVMVDTKNTLFDRSDDYAREYGVSDGLLSKYAWGCLVDKNDVLYVANEIGLLMYDGTTFSSITNISEQELFDVELDSEGRVWIMARDGIYYYDPLFDTLDGITFAEINVSMEFLPFSNEVIQIQGFEFDPLRRSFWLGGETGLLQLIVQYDTLPDLEDVVVYPNPVLGESRVHIRNIPLDARVYIYSIAGRLIAEALEPDVVFGEVVWEIPDTVGSGLYFALVKSSRGNRVCKFAIVK